MKPSKKITYIVWLNFIFSILILLTTFLGSLPLIISGEDAPPEVLIWQNDGFLFPFAIVSKLCWLILGVGIFGVALGVRKRLEPSRSRFILLMFCYLLLHFVETLV